MSKFVEVKHLNSRGRKGTGTDSVDDLRARLINNNNVDDDVDDSDDKDNNNNNNKSMGALFRKRAKILIKLGFRDWKSFASIRVYLFCIVLIFSSYLNFIMAIYIVSEFYTPLLTCDLETYWSNLSIFMLKYIKKVDSDTDFSGTAQNLFDAFVSPRYNL